VGSLKLKANEADHQDQGENGHGRKAA